ncbi:MAG: transcription termination/antitermination protein NusA, partial [Patescibacteria group bacterium]
SVHDTGRGPEIIVSRSTPMMVQRIFESEIPEIVSGAIEIKKISRDAGNRAKVAVVSHDESIDPIGSCIGQRGSRIQMIIAELGGEKIDVILYDENPESFITNALSPAKISSIELMPESKTARVLVPEDQLSLAIGKGGQNVRLASQLTGWSIEVHQNGVVEEYRDGGEKLDDEGEEIDLRADADEEK